MNDKLDTRLTDYALGELDETARAEMKERLADDAAAQCEADEIARLGDSMRQATVRPHATVEEHNALLQDIIAAHLESQRDRAAAAAEMEKVSLPPAAGWSRKAYWLGGAAVAASLLLAFTIGRQFQDNGDLAYLPARIGSYRGAPELAAYPSATGGSDAIAIGSRDQEEIVTKLDVKIVPADPYAFSAGPIGEFYGLARSRLPGDVNGAVIPGTSAPKLSTRVTDQSTSVKVDVGATNIFTASGAQFAASVPDGRFGTPGNKDSNGAVGLDLTGQPMYAQMGVADGDERYSVSKAGSGSVALDLGRGEPSSLALNSGVAGTPGDVTVNGVLTVPGNNTFAGATKVDAGTLQIGNGTVPAASLPTTPLPAPLVHSPTPADPLRENGYFEFGRYGESQLQKEVALNVGTSLDQIRAKYGPNHPKTREFEAKFHALQQAAAELDRAAKQSQDPGQFNTEAYDSIVENPFIRSLDSPLSTFSIDVDTASYSNVRRFLNQGQLPPRGAVRVEEFLNYFTYSYPQAKGTDPFSITTEAARCPWNSDNLLIRVGLRGREVHVKERPATNLVFLVDVSGSMQDHDKLPLVRESLKMLVRELGDNDRVAIVVYAGNTGLVLPSTGGNEKPKILAAISKLEAGGSTNGGAGIQLAYDIAVKNFIKGGVNRVVLATDGDFNVGITSESDLVDLIEQKAKTGVFFSGLAFGTGNLKDATLEKLSDKGNGNYAYIDSLAEARKVLVEQMSATLVTIAKDVKVQIEFNPFRVESYRLIGYENRVLAAQDFNDDKKDAGEIGAGHTVTALYEVVPVGITAVDVNIGLPAIDPLKYQKPKPKPKPDPSEAAKTDELLTLKLRYKQPDGDVSKLIERPLKNDVKDYAKATADFKFAAAVASFGMQLRDSKYCGSATFDAVLELAQEGMGRDEGGYRREFIELVRKARELKPQSTQPR